MNEYLMEQMLDIDRQEKEAIKMIEEAMECDVMYEEELDYKEEEDWDDIHDEDWDDLFYGCHDYEDPMERAMHDVGMSWSDFI